MIYDDPQTQTVESAMQKMSGGLASPCRESYSSNICVLLDKDKQGFNEDSQSIRKKIRRPTLVHRILGRIKGDTDSGAG